MRVKKKIEQLENEISKLYREKIFTIESNLRQLEKQVKCSIALHEKHQGHEFVFENYYQKYRVVGYFNGSPLSTNDGDDYNAVVFKCKHCGITMTRKLTDKEKKALKVLGK